MIRRLGSLSSHIAPKSRREAAIQGRSGNVRPAMNDAILREISDFCRETGLAESTFGRRAVNDGKLASRLRNGGRITTDTLDRIRAFMAANHGPPAALRSPVIERGRGAGPTLVPAPADAMLHAAPSPHPASAPGDPQRNFRCF